MQTMKVKQMLLEDKMLVKIFLFALVLVNSTVVDIIFDISLTILVMVPVEAGFSGGLDPISLVRSTLALLLTSGLNCQRRYIL